MDDTPKTAASDPAPASQAPPAGPGAVEAAAPLFTVASLRADLAPVFVADEWVAAKFSPIAGATAVHFLEQAIDGNDKIAGVIVALLNDLAGHKKLGVVLTWVVNALGMFAK